MAYTKVFAVRQRLDHAISYAVNPEKIGLKDKIDYALNPNKTEQRIYESAINCQSTDTAFREMLETKWRYGKTDGVLAYHFIQSFKPGEVTPEQAHEIGVEFAGRCFGERFECVVGTHLDKGHLHSHIVVNSVSCTDGGKYRSTPASYFYNIRAESDRLCKEYGLSVINPKGKGRHYAEWQAEKNSEPTNRSIVRQDIDEVIIESFTYQSFLEGLKRRGYDVRYSPTRKYTTVIPPGAERAIRLTERSLGAGYSEEDIKGCLALQRNGDAEVKRFVSTPKHYRYKGCFKQRRRKKLKGFLALYWHYVYFLGKVGHGKISGKVNKVFRADVIKLEKYKRQFFYLYLNNISTANELDKRLHVIEREIAMLTEERNPLYIARKYLSDDVTTMAATDKIDALTEQLKELRREKRICEAIVKTSSEIRGKIVAVQDIQMETEKKHERDTRIIEREPSQYL